MGECFSVKITPSYAAVNGKRMELAKRGSALLVEIYRAMGINYPKFYKMDLLSKLGFIACELLLGSNADRGSLEECKVILFNKSASLCTDRAYQQTISDAGNYYPSPSVFVYTLPNIVTGEIAIRNKIYGETSFYVLDEWDSLLMEKIIKSSVPRKGDIKVITGWLDCWNEDDFEAELLFIEGDKACENIKNKLDTVKNI